VERTEALSAEVLEHKMKSRTFCSRIYLRPPVTNAPAMYASLMTHHNALKSLQREHLKHLERERQLGDILDNLRRGYNPNYQDMAVLEAVRGWEQLAHLPHIGEAEREEGSDEDEEATTPVQESDNELEEGEWTSLQLENELDGLLGVDHISLLMEHDAHVDDVSSVPSRESSMDMANKQLSPPIEHDIRAYLPDFLIPQYEGLRDTLVSWLQTLGVVRDSHNAASGHPIFGRRLCVLKLAMIDATRARERLNDAERNFDSVQKKLDTARTDLRDLFDPAWYGAEGEWKKLHNTCLTKDVGE
jgi:protein kinase C substrate 80K-H